MEDSLTGEPIVTFSERSPGAAGPCSACPLCAAPSWYGGCCGKTQTAGSLEENPSGGCGAAALGLLILLSLSGCSVAESANGIFNSSSQSVSETYSVIYDDQTRTYALENRATGALTDLALSPLFGAFSDGESIKAVYMDAPYIYYMSFPHRTVCGSGRQLQQHSYPGVHRPA